MSPLHPDARALAAPVPATTVAVSLKAISRDRAGMCAEMEQNDPACLAQEGGGCLLSRDISFCLVFGKTYLMHWQAGTLLTVSL